MYDAIKMLTNKSVEVNILGLGHVASMATVIMQAGTRRFSGPHTQFLVHQVRNAIGFFEIEEVNVGRERIEETERLNNIAMGLIAERTGIDVSELKELSKKKDFWLDLIGAKKLGKNGLIDEIITDLPF